MKLSQMTISMMMLCLLAPCIAYGQSLGTAFTYQGQLKDGGVAADGLYDLRFKLFNSATGGTQIGGTIQLANFPVTDGLFTVELDFGAGVYNNNSNPDERWLEVLVEQTTLSPRQPLTGVPYSIQTRGLDVVDDGAGLKVGVGRAATGFYDTFNVYTDSTGFEGMTVETPAGGSPLYAYKSGNNQSVYHYLDYDSQTWRLYNSADKLVAHPGPDGFVGINRADRLTGVSSEIFGIYDATSGLGGMIIETDANGEPYYGYGTDGNLRAYHYYDGNGIEWNFKFAGTPIALTLNSLGNLEIAGSAHKPGGGPWSSSSDRRLKKNITNLDGSLEKLMNLRGVTFEYLDPKSINELDGVRTGFVAQEVEKVFPGWVDEQSNGYKALTPRGFPALAVEAIRELRDEKNKQVAMLQGENDELRDENDELRDRLDAVESQVQQLLSASRN